jgi:hypothetical protein
MASKLVRAGLVLATGVVALTMVGAAQSKDPFVGSSRSESSQPPGLARSTRTQPTWMARTPRSLATTPTQTRLR